MQRELTFNNLTFRSLRASPVEHLIDQMIASFSGALAAHGHHSAKTFLSERIVSDRDQRTATIIASDRSERVMSIMLFQPDGEIVSFSAMHRPLRNAGALHAFIDRVMWSVAIHGYRKDVVLTVDGSDPTRLTSLMRAIGDCEVAVSPDTQIVRCLVKRFPNGVEAIPENVTGQLMTLNQEPAAQPRTPTRKPGRGQPTAGDRPMMTQAGLDSLKDELRGLTGPGRDELGERFRAAREGGSSADDVEWELLNDERLRLESRISQLQDLIARAVVVDPSSITPGVVSIGSQVTVTDHEESRTYTIVGATEANFSLGRISSASPLGKALIGKSVDDQVLINAAGRAKRLVVTAVNQ